MSLRQKLGTVRRLGLREATRKLLSAAAQALWTHERLVVFRMMSPQLNAMEPDLAAPSWKARSMDRTDFLTSRLPWVPAGIVAELAAAPPQQRVHWIEVEGEIASWGFSVPVAGEWPLTETRSHLVVPRGGVCLISFVTVPRLRGRRLYPAVLSQILRERFSSGYKTAYIWCRESNHASYRAIKRVGFEEFLRHDYIRVLGFPWRREREYLVATKASSRSRAF